MTHNICMNDESGWLCTLERGHIGKHKAFDADGEELYAVWENTNDSLMEAVTELLKAVKGLGIIGTNPEQVQVLHAAEKVKKILNEVSND